MANCDSFEPLNTTQRDSGLEVLESSVPSAPKPMTIWFTGLSGSGKSTVGQALADALSHSGIKVFILDGDNVRLGLCRDLSFSAADRAENIRRVAEVAKLMNSAGVLTICSCISPYQTDRENARAIIGCDRFLEIYLSTPLATCEGRDTKGLYRKARAGKIIDFTGVSAPYEVPKTPDVILDTSKTSLQFCVNTLLEKINLAVDQHQIQ